MKIPLRKLPQIKCISNSYLKAVQFSCDYAWHNNIKHKFELHKHIYKVLREQFNLKSQFAIKALGKGFEIAQSSKKLKGSKPIVKSAPLLFDKRLASFKMVNNSIRITTNSKRVDIPLNIPKYYLKYSDWEFQEAMLIERKGKWFFNIVVSQEVSADFSDSQITSVGIDLGINNIAVTSERQFFKGHKTKIKQFQWLRRKLQTKGTKSAKRRLKALSGRQKRYMAWLNHNISKQIVSGVGNLFIMEDLTYIRKSRTKYRKGKSTNRWINNWSFRQLQEMIRYKAEMIGKRLVLVNPYMTSQTCSNCGKFGSRYSSSFVCSHCNFVCDSDLNASFNLRRLSVTQPNIPTQIVRDNQSESVKPHTSV